MAKKSAFEALQDIKKQAAPVASASLAAPTKSAGGKPSAFEALQELKKKKTEPAKPEPIKSEPVKTSPTTRTSVGPRISLLQQSNEKAAQPTIRAATPEEVSRVSNPTIRAQNNAIGNATPEAHQIESANNVPSELHGFVTKTLPGLAKTGANLTNNAEKISKQLGLSKAGIEAVGNTLTHSSDILSDFTYKASKIGKSTSVGNAAHNVLDAAIAAFNVGAIPFIAATEGVKTIPGVGKPIGKAVEKTFETIQKAGSYGFEATTKGYYDAYNTITRGLGRDTTKDVQPSGPVMDTARELGGLAGIIVGMKLVHSGVEAGKAKVFPTDPAYGAATVLGIEGPKKPGGQIKVDEAAINESYSKAVDKARASGANVDQKVDTLTVARRILVDRANKDVAANARWQEMADNTREALPRVMEQSRQAVETITQEADAANAKELRDQPIKGRTPVVKRLSETGKLTYEAEFENNFQEAAKKAVDKGVKIRMEDTPESTVPGTFDPQTGEIVLNKSGVKNLIDRAERGERILIGSDKQAYVLEAKAGESRAALEKRVIEDIIAHEKAHFDTVTPEDAAALRKAIELGDKKAYYEKVQELENKANAVKSVRGAEEPGVIDAIMRESNRLEAVREARAELKRQVFEDAAKEAAYKAERKPLESENPEFRRRAMREAEIRKTIKEKMAESTPKTREEVRVQKAVRREVKKALREERASEAASKLKQERDAQFNDVVQSKDAVSTGKEGETRKLTAQENKYKSKLESQKSILDSKALLDKAILRLRKEAVIEKLKSEKVSSKEARGAVVDYIKQNVPAELRGTVAKDFLVRLRDANSKSDLQKIFREVDARYNKAKRVDLQSKIKKSLKKTILKKTNGISQAKFGKIQPTLDIIREGALNGSYSEAFRKITDNVASAERLPNGDLPESVVLKNQILQTFGIKEQTVFQLERTLQTIESLKEKGKTELREMRDERKARQERVIESAKQTITGGKEVDTGIAGVQSEKNGKFMQAVKDHFDFKSAPLDFIMNTLSRADKASATFKSPLNRLVNKLAQSRYEAVRLDREMESARVSMLEKAYGKKGGKLLREWKDVNTKKEFLGEFSDADGKKTNLKLTRAERMNIYAESRNTSTRTEILERNRFTPEMLDAVEKSLKPEDKAFADSMFEYYGQHYQAFADAFYRDTGAMLPKADRYIPRWAEGSAKNDVSFASLLADDVVGRLSIKPGSSRSRVGGGEIKFSYDPLAKMRDYSTQVNHYTSTLDAVKDMKSVFSDAEIRKIIKAQHGDVALKMIDHHIDLATRGGVDGTLVNKWLSKLSSNMSRAFINTPSVVLGQPSSNAQFLASSNTMGGFARGLASYATRPVEATKLMMKYSSEFRERYSEGGGKHLEEAKVQSTLSQLSGVHKLLDIAEMPLQAADYLGIAPGGWAIFREKFMELEKKGFSSERAKELAGEHLDTVIRTTQSTSGYTGKSYFETSGSLNKMLSMLQNQPNKVFQVVRHAWGDAAAGKISVAKAAKITAVYGVVLPMLYTASKRAGRSVGNAIADTVAGTTDEQKKKRKEKEQSYWSEAMGEIAAQPVTSPIIVGDMVKSALEWAQGKNYGYRPGVVFSLVDTIQQGVTQLASGDVDEAILYGLKAASQIKGVPYSQQMLQAQIQKASDKNKAKHAAAKKGRTF